MIPAVLNEAITERAFQQQIMDLAKLKGYLSYHTFLSKRSQPGFPDLVLVGEGRIIFAELKSQRGKLSQWQKIWLGALQRTGLVEVYCWKPNQWADIVRILS